MTRKGADSFIDPATGKLLPEGVAYDPKESVIP